MRESLDNLLYNLAVRGFELGNTPDSGIIIPTEELILAIGDNCLEARVLYGVPVVIKKNQIDYDKIIKEAIEKNLQNRIGYLLEETARVFDEFGETKDREKLESSYNELYRHKLLIEETLLRRTDSRYIENAKKKRCELLKKWNLIAVISHDDFVHAYKTYVKNGRIPESN